MQIKKYRKQEQRFTVEGAKSVQELLNSDFTVHQVIGTQAFLSNIRPGKSTELIEVSEKVLEDLGEFQSNSTVVAVASMKPNQSFQLAPGAYGLVLDDIRDPGNLGTIIRTADWYGISHIVASEETADFYNPKVISATMGSFTRMNVYYTSLTNYLSQSASTVFGAFLDGNNVHEISFDSGGLIVIGNESRGISPEVEKLVTQRITIPRFGKAESLNAAIATAIICDNIRR